MSVQTEAIRAVEAFVQAPSTIETSLRAPAHALLLLGPSGCGKTFAVNHITNKYAIHTIPITNVSSANDLLRHSLYAEREDPDDEENNHSINKQVIIFLDDLDVLCPHSPRSALASTLVGYLDRCSRGSLSMNERHVRIICATHSPESLDARLRHNHRFPSERVLGSCTRTERLDLLTTYSSIPPSPSFRASFISRTHGWVVGDVMHMMRHLRISPPPSQVRYTRASLTRHSQICAVEDGRETWSSVGGLGSVKRVLRIAVEWPLRYGAELRRLGIRESRGVLLWGAPGCGKTKLVRVAAQESGARLVTLCAASVYSCYVGEAERHVREMFAIARKSAPCVLFMDEIDALVGNRHAEKEGNDVRDRVLAAVLTEMDGVQGLENVVVVAATNRLDMVDAALKRVGRFDHVVHVPVPDAHARYDILMQSGFRDKERIRTLVEHMQGWSGADIQAWVSEQGLQKVRDLWNNPKHSSRLHTP